MDLIYTNSNKEDVGVLSAYGFDLSFGASENDFELTLDNANALDYGAVVYIEGTEYGGIVAGKKTSTNSETINYYGSTWHGVLNSKVIAPDSGADYLIMSGDAHSVLATLIARLGLSDLFSVPEDAAGIAINRYQFARYCKGYDGIKAMLSASGAKLQIKWENRSVILSAVPLVDYTEYPVDGDIATLTVEQYRRKVNHLICLGKGDLSAREVIHLYVDHTGKIGSTQYYTGLDEIADVYDYNNAESSAELRTKGIEKLTEFMNTDKAEMKIPETDGLSYDIGDIVGASDIKSGVTVTATVTQKIVKINNGAISTEYKTGG